MTFRAVDEELTRQMTGDARAPAAEHLDLRLVQFGRGVAVYEMPLRWYVRGPSGTVAGGAVTTLAEAAMTAAARTTVADDHDTSPLVLELGARFHRALDAGEPARLRAEAVVMRTDPHSVRVEAEVHCDGLGVATFEAVYTREGGTAAPPSEPPPAAARPLAEA